MRYQLLGRSGLRVSELCLGTMTFGAAGWGTPEPEAAAMVKRFRDAGGNFFDTANEIYAGGLSEEILGRLVAGERDQVVIATKYGLHVPGTNNPNAAGNQRKSLKRSIESSLKRLGTDYVDLLWTHCWDGVTPADEVMRALDDLVRQGKVLHIGVCNTPAWVVSRSNTLAELRGWTAFAGLQVEYSLLERTAERELLPMARALGLGVAAWSPLASGILSGKYADPGAGDGARLQKAPMRPLDERSLALARGVAAVAAELGRPPAQVALNWVRAQAGVLPLLGARTDAQLQDNLACLDFTLEPETLVRLDALSAIEPGFPHDYLRRTRALATAGFDARLDLTSSKGPKQ
ncbi:aldo/keto reductase [Aquincola sp. S2]|uniref:Aldo/keto reductase n=1 Tax=Pseudaquabacterium terrae TaxID=2732868 RepID=A0ABX2ETP7_9BURK|nr:aldo/keto reductase [Aquabacterium terrae]NRF72018.1 aldo/keto reductase [Aquabacterium terrae]